MNSYDFRSRVAIITGGGQGIGLTFAERILASGGQVSV
jgi:2-dehydro-3-deoxy-L-rhamnonate dehydrogenase (NAD+)